MKKTKHQLVRLITQVTSNYLRSDGKSCVSAEIVLAQAGKPGGGQQGPGNICGGGSTTSPLTTSREDRAR